MPKCTTVNWCASKADVVPRENSLTHDVGVSYVVLLGKDDVVMLESPTYAALGINVYDSLCECARKRNLSVQGVESRNFKECQRVSIAMEALIWRGPGAPEPQHEAVERLVYREPAMGMEPEREERERAIALTKAVETAVVNGLSAVGRARLREIFYRHWNAFRQGLRGDPPARVEPLAVTFKPEANVVKARGSVYSSIKIAWLATCIGILVALGLVFRNLQAV